MRHVRPKKHLGQHFLNDKNIAIQITSLLNRTIDHVVEIGPGMGVLTQFLLEKEYKTHTIEIDRESIAYLKLNYPNLIIHEGDFLKVNLKKEYPFKFALIGNFPYNISSQILFKIFENKDQIPELVGMFQKEVAERIACKKGKKRGILSVLIQTFYNVEYCLTVDKHVFTPPPKIQSGVIKLTRNNREKLPVEEKKFKHIVKTAFNQKRKTLKNALKSLNLIEDKEILDLLTLRAEQLSIDEFIKITQHVR